MSGRFGKCFLLCKWTAPTAAELNSLYSESRPRSRTRVQVGARGRIAAPNRGPGRPGFRVSALFLRGRCKGREYSQIQIYSINMTSKHMN